MQLEDWDDAYAILRATTPDDIGNVTARFTQRWGYHYHGYSARLVAPPSRKEPDTRLFGNFPADWVQRHGALRADEAGANQKELSDPRVRHVRATLPATSWTVSGSISYTRLDLRQVAKPLLRLAGDAGMGGGLTIPLASHGIQWATMTFATRQRCTLRDLAPSMAPALYFASCIQAALSRVEANREPRPGLSPSEREVLHWAAIGKTSWEISLICRVSERTVNFHLSNAARKMGTRGRGATCARALALGLIAL
jgi:LuxR family transcriptional activator of bioluminescence operon